MSTIGEVVEREEGVFEWTVRDFMSLPDQVDDRYDSPTFSFGDALWHLSLYPNGERNKSEGYMGLYVARRFPGPPIELNLFLGMKTTNNEIFREVRGTGNFEDTLYVFGTMFRRSRLLGRQSELAPSGHLTFVCRMEHPQSTDAAEAVPATTNTPDQQQELTAIDKTMSMTSSKSEISGP